MSNSTLLGASEGDAFDLTALYRFFAADGQLLYIGITIDVASRWLDHAKGKKWWREVKSATIEHYSTREEAAAAEESAIRSEKPLWNIMFAMPVSTDRGTRAARVVRKRAADDDFVSVTEAAAMFHPPISGNSIRNLCDNDTLRSNYTVGGHRRIERKSVEEVIKVARLSLRQRRAAYESMRRCNRALLAQS